jgi:diaminopimelate epimerase
VRLYLPEVGPLRHIPRLEAPPWSGPANFVWVGVPHAIVWVEDLEEVDVDSLGRALRHHAEFSPRGANINFAAPVPGSGGGRHGAGEIAVRTYERGVECETLACGTGSVAVGYSAAVSGRAKPPVTIRVRGGVLVIGLEPIPGGGARKVTLTGPARIAFSGVTTWNRRTRGIEWLQG